MNGLQRYCSIGIALLGVWAPAPLTADIINDGSRTDNLVRIANVNGVNGAEATLTPQSEGTSSVLLAEQTVEGLPFFALRNVWYASDRNPTNQSYTVSASFKPAQIDPACRGGVMGWLDITRQIGIAFYTRPAASGDIPAAFVVATIDFAAETADANESTQHLFNLDGTPAETSVASSEAALGDYHPANAARLELAFAPPTSQDLQSLPSATARLTAQAYFSSSTGTGEVSSRPIQLLTDLSLPPALQHRLGYFAYWGSIFGIGSIGHLANLSGSGGIGTPPNSPPVIAISAPSHEASFTAPADISIIAEASDRDGAVVKIEFFAGASQLGVVVSDQSPLTQAEFVWRNAPPGRHALSARATDNRGGATASTNLVQIVVDAGTPPTLNIESTANGVQLSWNESFQGYRLETSPTLLVPIWQEIPNTSNNRVTLPAAEVTRFFRLAR